MAAIQAHDIHVGAQVFTADGHDAGKVIEPLTDEFIVEEGHLRKHHYMFQFAAVKSATPQRVDLTFNQADLTQKWNEITLTDAHGHHRHVIQVGTAPSARVPYYDEEQTTTGGPPTNEADE
jgi:hypothetical protein